MFLKLEYSEIDDALVIKGAEDLNRLPEALYRLPMTMTEVISLLEDIRAVSVGGEHKVFDCGSYLISLTRGSLINSTEALSISIEEVKGEMTRPVFVSKFEGYYGSKNLLDGLRSFKLKLNDCT